MNFLGGTAALVFLIAMGIVSGGAKVDEAGITAYANAFAAESDSPRDGGIDLPPIGADLPALERSKSLIEKGNGLLREMIAKQCEDYGEDLEVVWEVALRNLAKLDSHVSKQRTEYQQAWSPEPCATKNPARSTNWRLWTLR